MRAQELHLVTNFFNTYPVRRYKKGQIFVLAGEQSEYVYFLLRGHVKIYDISYRGDEIILHIYAAPALFPISHAVLNTKNHYIYEAESDVTVKRSLIEPFQTFIRSSPLLTWATLRDLYTQIQQLYRKEVLLVAGDARSRLLYELVTECEEFGVSIQKDTYKIDIREREIGARIGMSRETVSREAKKLERRGLINLEYMAITIPSLTRLKAELTKFT